MLWTSKKEFKHTFCFACTPSFTNRRVYLDETSAKCCRFTTRYIDGWLAIATREGLLKVLSKE